MNVVKQKIHNNYRKSLDRVANGGKAPNLKSKHSHSFDMSILNQLTAPNLQ